MHVIVFGKIAILSPEGALNCTSIPYFEEVSKYLCMERSLAWSSRMKSPPYYYHLPSGLSLWRTQIVFLFWDLVLQESTHFLLWTLIHSPWSIDKLSYKTDTYFFDFFITGFCMWRQAIHRKSSTRKKWKYEWGAMGKPAAQTHINRKQK